MAVEQPPCLVCLLRNGKCVEARAWLNHAEALEAAGLSEWRPQPPQPARPSSFDQRLLPCRLLPIPSKLRRFSTFSWTVHHVAVL